MVRKCLRAQSTPRLNRHKQHQKHWSESRRCSQTPANFSAGAALQLKWGSIRAKTSTGHFIPWKYHSIEKWQYIFLNWYEATDQEGSCVLEETQLQSSAPHERGHATDRSEKGRAGLRADGYDDSATISVALRRQSQERPDVSKQGEKTFWHACLGGRARRWDTYPSDWELWGSPAQDLTKISFGFDINTHMRSNWYLFTGWIILADKTTSFKQ